MGKGIRKNTVPKAGIDNPSIPKSTGRKLVIIDWSKVDNYLIAGCSGIQIASVLGIHYETLYTKCEKEKGVLFSEYALEKLEKGNAALLGKQFDMAMKGDKALVIWLGKQRLGQSDKHESKIETNQVVLQKIILSLPDNGRRYLKEKVNESLDK